MARYFTREEAEALLPLVTIILQRIQVTRQGIRVLEGELGTLREKARGNGHGLHEKIMHIQHDMVMRVRVLQEAVLELETIGCELKDPDMGLIDFLTLRNGEEVYLCWHLGEERIVYWHELATGFAGRQPLDEE